jgi:hypothetical protein
MIEEQGANANGNAIDEGAVAEGLLSQVEVEPEGNTIAVRAAGDIEVPHGEPGGPLSGSSLTGAVPADVDGGGGGTDPDLPEFAIVSINPDEFPAGYPDTGGTVSGVGFEDGAVIVFGGADMATDFISDNQLNFTLPSSTSAEGPVQVAVRNPGGELTAERTFTFVAPAADDEAAPAKKSKKKSS